MPAIRPETLADAAGVDALLAAAFGSRQVPGLVRMIRDSPEYEPALALVSEAAGGLVGFVLLSRVPLLSSEGRWWWVLTLGPLAVRPDCAGRGIGSALVRHSLALADRRGDPLVILEGDPGFYARLGFEPAEQHGLERPSDLIPRTAFQVRRLSAYDPAMRGRIVYPEAFWRCAAVGPSPGAVSLTF